MFPNRTPETANYKSAGSDNGRVDLFRESADVCRSPRNAGARLRCRNCLAVGRKALACTQRLLSIQSVLAGRDKRLHQRGTSISAALLPARTRNSLGPVPTGRRAVSAGHAPRFHLWCLLLLQPFRQIAGPISDNNVRAGAFEGGHNFKNSGTFVQEPFFGGAFDHRIFPANMVNGSRFSEALTDTP